MGNLESKLHAPGVMIYRAKGNLTADDLEKWREELVKFVRENNDKGACGMLIDACQLDSIATDSIDALMEILTDPEEVIRDVKMRFAFIGVKPFTQRFLRETLPLEEVKHIRARFFHEVSENEAIAWLTAMVSSADETPERKPEQPETPPAKPPSPTPAKPAQAIKEPAKPKPESEPAPKPTTGDKAAEPAKKPAEPAKEPEEPAKEPVEPAEKRSALLKRASNLLKRDKDKPNP